MLCFGASLEVDHLRCAGPSAPVTEGSLIQQVCGNDPQEPPDCDPDERGVARPLAEDLSGVHLGVELGPASPGRDGGPEEKLRTVVGWADASRPTGLP